MVRMDKSTSGFRVAGCSLHPRNCRRLTGLLPERAVQKSREESDVAAGKTDKISEEVGTGSVSALGCQVCVCHLCDVCKMTP